MEKAGGKTPRDEAGPDFCQGLFLRFVWGDAVPIPSDLRDGSWSPEELFFTETDDAFLFQGSERCLINSTMASPSGFDTGPRTKISSSPKNLS